MAYIPSAVEMTKWEEIAVTQETVPFVSMPDLRYYLQQASLAQPLLLPPQLFQVQLFR